MCGATSVLHVHRDGVGQPEVSHACGVVLGILGVSHACGVAPRVPHAHRDGVETPGIPWPYKCWRLPGMPCLVTISEAADAVPCDVS